ncbi:MAG TPA: ribonuclease HI family protein [Candidatus Bathyarchaeia archaeon]|nr:ribonuclease HI family protein [Candidatus Bathyarchaeia archaeon]
MPVLWIDGQSLGNQQKTQPRLAKIAVAYKEKPNSSFHLHWEEIGDRTNNEAEYYALIKALNMVQAKWDVPEGASRKGVEPIKIHSDSLLIVNQVKGAYEVTDVRLRTLCESVKTLMKKLSFVKLEWIPREENFAGQWLEDKWKGGKIEVVKDGEPAEVVAKV